MSSWDHRVGLGSSPAQSHSTRHAHTATIPVGHSGDGFEPWYAHPQVAQLLERCYGLTAE